MQHASALAVANKVRFERAAIRARVRDQHTMAESALALGVALNIDEEPLPPGLQRVAVGAALRWVKYYTERHVAHVMRHAGIPNELTLLGSLTDRQVKAMGHTLRSPALHRLGGDQ